MLDTVPQELLALAEALLALALGGLVGFEREAAGKWAGLRTHMLVCLSAFLFVKTGQLVTVATALLWAASGVPADAIRSDPVRIIQAVAVGISFVGAGAVFRDRDRVRGLTSAASLLVVAPIGLSVALGRYVLAAGAAVLVVVVLRLLDWVERKVFGPDRVREG